MPEFLKGKVVFFREINFILSYYGINLLLCNY